MQNNDANGELANLKRLLAEALVSGSDAEVLSARRAISHYYRGSWPGLTGNGMADLRNR